MIALLAATLLAMQDDLPPPQGEIDRAVKAGAEALLNRVQVVLAGKTGVTYGPGYEFDSLLLLTLVHSKQPLDAEVMQGLVARVREAPLKRTYQVAITAAALAVIDPIKHQEKLAQCAQYLVDFQADNGQWSYGDAYEFPQPDVKAASRTVATIKIKRIKKLGPKVGDNSNAQYAALGLKSCAAGGIEIDPATLSRAIEWWEKAQQDDGGWGYDKNGTREVKDPTYGSMTAGAISSLIMLKHLKKIDVKASASIKRGFAWMAHHFTVETNPGQPAGLDDWRYYYLYAMERAGDLYPTEKIGKHAWYAAGAAHLLKIQRSNGMWVSNNPNLTILDTCFALLFLERAARPPVATGGSTK